MALPAGLVIIFITSPLPKLLRYGSGIEHTIVDPSLLPRTLLKMPMLAEASEITMAERNGK